MKQFSSFVVAALMSVAASAQVAVGTTSPSPSARFEVNSSTQGFLGPRVALTGTDDVTTIKNSSGTTVTPATGLMVYNTATAGTGSNSVTPGLYTFNGTSWDRSSSIPTTIVAGTPSYYRIASTEVLVSSDNIGYDAIGQITLPAGKWEIIANYTCVVYSWGCTGGTCWDQAPFKYNTYWISSASTPGINNYSFPVTFPSGEVTSDALFSGSAVASIPLYEPQRMTFLINNTTGSDKTYELRWRESYLPELTTNGPNNSYVNTQNLNRLYAVKIQ